MKFKPILLGITFFALAILAPLSPGLTQPRRRQSCPDVTQATPARDNREIRNREFGFQFTIPANYQTERRRNENQLLILLRNPADVDLLDCCTQNREIGCGHRVSDVVISIEPIPSNIKSVADILQQRSTDLNELFNIRNTRIGNREAVIYTIQSQYPERYIHASFFTPNQQSLVTISAGDYGEDIDPIDESVFNRVIDSFVFQR